MHLMLLLWAIHEYAIFFHAGILFNPLVKTEAVKQSRLYLDSY